MPDYPFKTKPFSHQEKLFLGTRDQTGFCIHWEQGCGKSKLGVDTAAWLYLQGLIDGGVVVAPNGVHSNWRDNELPAHLPDRVMGATRSHVWDSKTAKRSAVKADFKATLEHPGMAWLMMGYGALATEAAKEALADFLTVRRSIMIVDESARIKNPKAERTKALMAIRHLAKYRRSMTGTPISQSPFDFYSQIEWVFPGYWKSKGFGSFTAFKHYFGEWERRKDSMGRQYETLKKCVNLPELGRLVRPISSRVVKADVLDLPPKVYRIMAYDMSAEQKRMYADLKADFVTWLKSADPDSGAVSAEMAITRMMRMQQITLGYVRLDGEDEITDLKDNPRLDLLGELIEDMGTDQCLIWARYRRDVDKIMGLLGKRAVKIDGSVAQADRVRAVAAIQGGDTQFFVGTPAAAGEGWTMTAANQTIYYSNSYRLGDRLQSEDRNHRIGQVNKVTYTDIVARGSMDRAILRALRMKKNISDIVLGDEKFTWFEQED
jgi:SNF2 family DNA or RNA helicase